MRIFGLGAVFCVLAGTTANADPVADFYRGRTVEMIVGAAAGGGFDITARPLVRFMSRYMPGNPTFIVRNMPGAAGMVMTNYLATAAPRDGTSLGMSTSNIPYEPRLKIMSPDGRNVNFDPQKLNWIGTPVREPQVSWVWHTSGVKTWEDLRTAKIRFGATSPAGDNAVFPALVNQLLGLRSDIITGYQGVGEIFLAIERGELEANNTSYSNLTVSKPDWLHPDKTGLVKARIIMQFGLQRLPAMKDVPTILELATNEDDREMLRFFLLKFEMSRPVFGPPGVPPERVASLRAAFDAAVKDPEFLAETARSGLDISPLGGEAVAKLVDEIMTTPQPVVDRMRAALEKAGAK